jgi:hypothetical protein
MTVSVDVVLRGTNVAKTETIEGIARAPEAWTDEDVRTLLEGMVRAMDRQRRPGEEDRPIVLRGLSWIVNPYDEGGVVLAVEITLGAAVAGPFAIDKARLEQMVTRILAQPDSPPAATTVH